MKEYCPLPEAPTVHTIDMLEYPSAAIVSEKDIPAKCFGCLALARAGSIPHTRTEVNKYDEVLAEIKKEDPEFSDDEADKFSSVSFVAPTDQSGKRVGVLESGFEYGGWNEALTDSISYDFECPKIGM